jgi:putative transcriptional regulator
MASEKKESLYLTGKLLLAMPSMGDPRFHRAVIFMCAHDTNGAMGLVINHTLPGLEFSQLLSQLKIVSDINVNFRDLPVMAGGPVESARGFLLHSGEFTRKDTVKIDTYGITGTIEALRDIVAGNGPGQLLFILGYAGWGAGQLDREIQDNAWLVVDADPEIIFHAEADEKWEMACAKLGINPAMLSGEAGRA